MTDLKLDLKLDLNKYIAQGITFEQYLADNQQIIENKSADAAYLDYYALNLKRMERLSKTVKLTENHLTRLQHLNQKYYLLIITEGWCADAAQIIPVVNKIAENSDQIEVRIVYRDENESLMNQYLTNGSKSIPIVIGVQSATGEEAFVWGPRPEFGNEILKQFKSRNFSVEEFKLNLQKAYNKDKGISITEEVLSKLKI